MSGEKPIAALQGFGGVVLVSSTPDPHANSRTITDGPYLDGAACSDRLMVAH
jgi:hypothetical protein